MTKTIIVLHGGPAAYGSADPLAKGLEGAFRVLAPRQRHSGEVPLSVKVHVEDLHRLIQDSCPDERPALAGHSWGAMLALAYAAKYPATAGPLALVACGTFTRAARARGAEVRKQRLEAFYREHPEHRVDRGLSISDQIIKWHSLVDSFEILPPAAGEEPPGPVDQKGFIETWNDMLRCQADGIYPQAFAAITSPVIMLHGAHDPHPGKMIYASLRPFIPRMEYREFEKCGHEPWIERHARDPFFTALREWLQRTL